MTVLVIADSPAFTSSYGGIARHFGTSMAKRGVDVAFVSFQHPGAKLVFESDGFRFPHYGAASGWHRAADAVREFDPDLILHIRDYQSIAEGTVAGAYSVRKISCGKPVWGWLPVMDETVSPAYVNAMHREYDTILAFTPSGAELLGNAGVVRDRLEVLMPGVSAAYSDPEGPTVNLGRPGVPLVMSVGVHDQDRKTFPVLMRAYRSVVANTDLDFYLHTAQVGTFHLLEHISDQGVTGHWLFPMFYDKAQGLSEETLAKYYRTARAYVAVGTGEGLDLPAMEAAALGRMVIAPDFPNHHDVLREYPDELKRLVLTHPIPRQTSWEWLMDADSLAAALSDVTGAVPSPDAGRAYYSEHSWDVAADRFMEIAHRRGFE
jgi:hypothetical protein